MHSKRGGGVAPCGSCTVGCLVPTKDGSSSRRRPEVGTPPLSPPLVCLVPLLVLGVTVTGAVLVGLGFPETVRGTVPPVRARKKVGEEGMYTKTKADEKKVKLSCIRNPPLTT